MYLGKVTAESSVPGSPLILGPLVLGQSSAQSPTRPGGDGMRHSLASLPWPKAEEGRDYIWVDARGKPAPFGSCSGDSWALSISCSRSSRALSWPSELSCLSSPSTLSRAVGRTYGRQARGVAGPGAAIGMKGREPALGWGPTLLVPIVASNLYPQTPRSKLEARSSG